jgi:N-acetylmuramic acid 6-phosphate etherase
LRQLETEQRNAATLGIDLASTEEVLHLIHRQDRSVLDVVEAAIPQLAAVVDRIVEAFRQGGRLVYAGAGTSGRLGVLDAAECPPTFGTDPQRVVGLIAGGHATLVQSQEGVEDRAEDGAADVDRLQLDRHDVLIGLSASRRTPYVRGALERARARGAQTVFVICNELGEAPQQVADLVIELRVGPEAITGSTRMKSGLAQKLALTMLSTAAMVRWGKVYENLMVDVRPTSAKLVERAKGLVMHLGGVEYERATQLLEQSEHDVKLAVLMARGLDLPEARRRLAGAGGFLRRALDATC